MGFKVGKIYKLSFEDERFEGLEVRVKSMQLGQFIKLASLIDEGGFTGDTAEEIFERFSKVLVSWNAEDDEGPLPITAEGLLRLDLVEARAIVEGWRDAVTGVTGPLDKSSTSGEQYPEGSIPMEILSENQAS